MIPKLEHYNKIIGKDAIEKIRASAEPLQNKHIVHINATSIGGGVAEILNTLVFLMNDVGIDTGWRTLLGSHSFFKITKGIHNALQGDHTWRMTKERKEIFLEYCKRNSMINHIENHDIVIIHDPQPLGMIANYSKKTTWLWRCHIDLSTPNKQTMNFLLPYIKKYNGVIISSKKFRIKGISTPQFTIPPSIDPLSPKNKKLSNNQAKRLLSKKGINFDKPIISQISRFDPWKNQLGLIRIYNKIREKHDCQLVMMGDMAADDPQGPLIYHKIKQLSESIPGITIITEKNDLLVNALQQESRVVFQNSIREGFALTVSEAMWKKTPVIGTMAGGIPLQIKNGKTGFIMRNELEGVKQAIKLLKNKKLRSKMGLQAHEYVKQNFLITRQLQDYIDVFLSAQLKEKK